MAFQTSEYLILSIMSLSHEIRSWLWFLSTLCLRLWYIVESMAFTLFNMLFTTRSIVPQVTDPLLLHSAVKLARMIKNREVSSEAVVVSYIDRIQLVNPTINAVVQSNFDEALRTAREIDNVLAQNDASAQELLAAKPLLGVPFTLKDCIFVKNLICTAGTYARRHKRMNRNATVVDRMQSAGAIVLAVTNVSEACMWWESSNTVYGRTNNPYDTRRIVGGSSGGEGALLAAAGSVIGIGSDIGGSLRMPAFFNGVFTHKISPGFIPHTESIAPECFGYQHEMHTIGPMCRYYDDLIPMLKCLVDSDKLPRLNLEKPIPIKSLRFFYMEEIKTPATSHISVDTRRALRKVVHYIERRHDIICHRVDLPLVHAALSLWLNDMSDVPPNTPKFTEELLDRQGNLNPWTELVRWMCGRSHHTLPALALGGLERVFDKYLVNPQQSTKIRAARERLERQLDNLLGDDGVLLMPSHPTTAPYHCQPIFQPFNAIYTALLNSIRLPVTQCPLGLAASDGLPTGIQVIANREQDRLCLTVAAELNNAFGGWRMPNAPF